MRPCQILPCTHHPLHCRLPHVRIVLPTNLHRHVVFILRECHLCLWSLVMLHNIAHRRNWLQVFPPLLYLCDLLIIHHSLEGSGHCFHGSILLCSFQIRKRLHLSVWISNKHLIPTLLFHLGSSWQYLPHSSWHILIVPAWFTQKLLLLIVEANFFFAIVWNQVSACWNCAPRFGLFNSPSWIVVHYIKARLGVVKNLPRWLKSIINYKRRT